MGTLVKIKDKVVGFVKKEVVNVDFGKDNSQLSSPVSQSAKQPPIADKK